jgi:hypothetical protein
MCLHSPSGIENILDYVMFAKITNIATSKQDLGVGMVVRWQPMMHRFFTHLHSFLFRGG